MKKNEERIWDVLIEDALREQPVESAPPGEHTRRLLQPVGPIGVDRGRSMRRGGRRKWLPAAAAVTALLLVAGILYAGAVWLPRLSGPNQATPNQPQTAEDSDQSPPRQRWSANEAPDNQPEDQTEPTPEPEPQPEPERGPETPEPTPEPTRPAEKPEPEPEPTPEPVKPEDVVEQPKQPEDTTAAPEAGPTIRVLSTSKRARLEFSTGAEREYTQAGERTELPNGAWLACRKPVDLLAGAVLLRLKGELRVRIGDGTLELQLDDDDLYIDSRGANRAVSLNVENHSLSLTSGAALIENGASGVDVTVYGGEVRMGEDVIPAGRRGVLKKRGLTGLFDPRDSMGEAPFLKGLDERVVYREDFDADPEGRLREGKLDDGVISGGTVFWGYPRNIAYEPGLVIRLRVRFTNAAQATLMQFCEERKDNYSVELKDLKQGEWLVLEVRVDGFTERTNHEGHPQVGESFMNVSLHPAGENAQVELDWVELIRAVK
jgi:hypothetical protein